MKGNYLALVITEGNQCLCGLGVIEVGEACPGRVFRRNPCVSLKLVVRTKVVFL